MGYSVCYVIIYGWPDIKKPKYTQSRFPVILVYILVSRSHIIQKIFEMSKPQHDFSSVAKKIGKFEPDDSYKFILTAKTVHNFWTLIKTFLHLLNTFSI